MLYKDTKLSHINNPLPNNLKRLRTVAILTNIDEKNFVSLVIMNKPAFVNDIKSSRDNEFVVMEKYVSQFIKESESKKTLDEKLIMEADRQIKT